MSLEIVYHLWHRDYTCRQYDSRESVSGEEKTPGHPEIELELELELDHLNYLFSELSSAGF